jgi:hypothetical protein
MGTDIHIAVETRGDDGTWTLVDKEVKSEWGDYTTNENGIPDSRDYRLFGVLAGVRGKAPPITAPKGLPADMSAKLSSLADATDDPEGVPWLWLGDHSFSWLTLREILDYDWQQTTEHSGWVNGPQFEEWQRMLRWEPNPPSWCGMVGGGAVVHVDAATMRMKVGACGKDRELLESLEHTFCEVHWTTPALNGCEKWVATAVTRLWELAPGNDPDRVRIVFGFDS